MKKHNGSALITIVLMLSVILIISTNMLRYTVFAQDIALERQKYEQEYQVLCGLMNYALELCKENFDSFFKNGNNQVCNFSLNNWYGRDVVMNIEPHIDTVIIQVCNNKKRAQILQCTLYKKENQFLVSNWQLTN